MLPMARQGLAAHGWTVAAVALADASERHFESFVGCQLLARICLIAS